LWLWQRQHAGRPAEAHRRRADDAPALRSDLDRTPALIGEIEIDVAIVFGEANMNRPFGTIKLGVRLEQIER
jgi:hypothetical protein